MTTAREVREGLPSLREIIRFADFDAFMNSGDPSVEFPVVKPRDPFMIIYTSGTTGVQKGALMHHLGRINSDYFVAERAGLEIGGAWVNPMPLFHNGGCGLAVLGSLRQRATLVLAVGFDVALILDLFEKEKGTFSLLVPTMLEAVLSYPDRGKYDLSTWRNVMSGASFVEVQLVNRVHEELGLGVSIVFGQTETHGVITATHREDTPEDQSATVGQPMPRCELKIADTKTGAVMPLNAVGEICIRGYQAMTEYYNMPEASAEILTPDGWLRTGDLGAMDERGFLKITGRLKEMIIRGGENIYPREVEILLEEHPKVGKAAVIGVPDQYWGEEVGAIIVPAPADAKPTPRELHDFCREHLTHFKAPRIWYYTKEFPYTVTGKLQKFVLSELVAKGELRPERT